MIKPWDLLTEEQKAVDYDLPKDMIDILEEFGYTVINNEDLDSILK